MHRLNCSDPIPPGNLEDITFWGVAPVFLSLYFYLAPPYLITLIPPFSSDPAFFHFIFLCPALFITHIFPSTPGQQGGWGMGEEQCKRCLTHIAVCPHPTRLTVTHPIHILTVASHACHIARTFVTTTLSKVAFFAP